MSKLLQPATDLRGAANRMRNYCLRKHGLRIRAMTILSTAIGRIGTLMCIALIACANAGSAKTPPDTHQPAPSASQSLTPTLTAKSPGSAAANRETSNPKATPSEATHTSSAASTNKNDSAALPRAPAAEASVNAPAMRLVLVPLGDDLADETIDFIRSCLIAFYDFRIEVLPRHRLPKMAYYPERQRYRADRLLDYLQAAPGIDADRVIGLTAVDISTSKGNIFDWGVLGLATIDGKVGVLSSFRCGRGVKTAQQAMYRFGKVAVHEVGHTLGLEHCPVVSCLMEDAKGTVTTSDREYDLCPACRSRLESLGRAARKGPEIPWPKPVE
jgi:archaemetzincin